MISYALQGFADELAKIATFTSDIEQMVDEHKQRMAQISKDYEQKAGVLKKELADRLGQIDADTLAKQEKNLRQAAKASPFVLGGLGAVGGAAGGVLSSGLGSMLGGGNFGDHVGTGAAIGAAGGGIGGGLFGWGSGRHALSGGQEGLRRAGLGLAISGLAPTIGSGLHGFLAARRAKAEREALGG